MPTLHHQSTPSSPCFPPTSFLGAPHSEALSTSSGLSVELSSRFSHFSIVICSLSDSKPDIISPCDIQPCGYGLSSTTVLLCINYPPISSKLRTMSITSQYLTSANHPHNCRDKKEFITIHVTLTWGKFRSNCFALG